MDFRFAPLAPVSQHFPYNDTILDVEFQRQDGELMHRASMHADDYVMITVAVFVGGQCLGYIGHRNVIVAL